MTKNSYGNNKIAISKLQQSMSEFICSNFRNCRSSDMEITQADLRIGDRGPKLPIVNKDDSSQESTPRNSSTGNPSVPQNNREPDLNSIQPECPVDPLADPVYLGTMNSETLNDEINRRMSQAADVYIKNEESSETSYISTVVISNDILDELNLDIKKESVDLDSDWLCEGTSGSRQESSTEDTTSDNSDKKNKPSRGRRRSGVRDYKERLRKKAEFMREKRKKQWEQESEKERYERLASEAARRRAMRMRVYENPEQRRKRLDSEAARKREYRMYNETPNERRNRLDREAERRRIKRLTMYSSETPEKRRERLNRESAKKREARLHQYAKETGEQREERLRKDALRAREMRFTRSAIETEEERRERLVKDALRKRELRMHCENPVEDLTELQTVRNFEELNNAQIKDDLDNQSDGHYIGNWTMWFENNIIQPPDETEQQNDD